MRFLGIDWGEHHHDLCLLDQDGSVLATRRIADGLAGVVELHALVAAYAEDPAQVVVGIETDVLFLENSRGDTLVRDDPDEIKSYSEAFAQLQDLAKKEDLETLIDRALKELS
jgi:Transposase